MSEIKLTADSGGGTTSLKAPSSTTSNADVVLKLPVADGSANQVLKTDGSGQLSFTSNAGTTINNNATTKFITGTNNANELDCEANLSYNNSVVTFSSSNLSIDKSTNPTVSAKETAGNKEVQLRANTTGGLLRTAGSYPLVLGTNQTERMRIDSSGNVGIGTTSPADKFHVVAGSQRNFVVRSTGGEPHLYAQNDSGNVENLMIGGNNVIFKAGSGSTGNEIARISENGGITFNGDTAAANGLDDYEEGTFTPSITMSNNDQSLGYAWRYGTYIKIGRKVYVEAYIGLNAISNNGSGYMKLVDLPFTANTGNVTYGGMHCPYYNSLNNKPMRGALVERNDTFAYVYYEFEGSSANGTILNATVANLLTTTSQFVLVGSYTVA